ILAFYIDVYVHLICPSGCAQEHTTETVSVGADVTLTCSRRPSSSGYLFWMKVVAGNLPEVLAATYTFDSNIANSTPRITTKQEPGTFLLHIKQTELKDTAFYYCEEIIDLQRTLWNVTFVKVKGPEAEITTVVQEPPSLPIHQRDSVTLQCLVQSESDDHASSDHHSVHWFKANDDESPHSKLYVHGKSASKCERIPETPSVRKCVHNFSLSDVGSSDAGTYYCAVVTCGNLLFGKGTKLEIEVGKQILRVFSIIMFFFFFFFLQTNENGLIYSAPNFAKKKAEQKGTRGAKAAEGQIIYAGVRTLGYE
uniref:Ig-like domain-containing protein n=1 Tax=Poecilia mexicana TaxID=48701 RepID=A0A3B3XJG4_9TELE